MLHAAAMLLGLAILWMLGAQSWSSPQHWAVALAASVISVLVALRFGGVGSAFTNAPRLVLVAGARIGSVIGGALATIRAAVSADVILKPALVRVRTRATRADERAAFAGMISATPGFVVVDTDAEGLLVHVMNEDVVDASDLGHLEQRTHWSGR